MMPAPPQQLVLDLPNRTALDAEDFLVSDANAAAIDVVDRWPNWQHWAVVVVGPEGSGKSHLANVWRSRSGAGRVEARDFCEPSLDQLRALRGLAIENLECGVSDEKALFHALNLAREHKYSILLTSRTAPGDLKITLPDLRSRLRALPMVSIEPPDQNLLQGLLVKLFADRQLAVEPQLIAHLVRHMERSASAAQKLVAEIDRRALVAHRKVTRALATEALASVSADET
ncbi:MAG: DnaA/Hda family protein [Hyphomicrobiaceae bacterium]